jgi:hypothetical protein
MAARALEVTAAPSRDSREFLGPSFAEVLPKDGHGPVPPYVSGRIVIPVNARLIAAKDRLPLRRIQNGQGALKLFEHFTAFNDLGGIVIGG